MTALCAVAVSGPSKSISMLVTWWLVCAYLASAARSWSVSAVRPVIQSPG
jgi:hypothetical protein